MTIALIVQKKLYLNKRSKSLNSMKQFVDITDP